jgi:fucose 4-O-acetylase-like acetyltransferase
MQQFKGARLAWISNEPTVERHLMQSNPPNDRNISLDIARGLGIFPVVFGHSLEITFNHPVSLFENQFLLWKLIYSFHMPLFFFVSGATHKIKSTSSVAKISLSLLLLAIFVHIFGWALGTRLSDVRLLELVKPIATMTNFKIGVMWYLVAHASVIFCYQLITQSSPPRTIGIVLIFLLLLGAQLLGKLPNYFQIQALAPGLLFYWLGNKYFCKMKRLSAPKLFVIFLLSTWLLAFSAFANTGCPTSPFRKCSGFYDEFAVLFIFGQYGFIPLFLLSATAGIASAISISL